MSVYTSISQSQLKLFLKNYSLGELINFSGIQAGIENTNYVVATEKGKFILTLYESLMESEVPKFLLLLDRLANNKFLVPKPQANISGDKLSTLKDKPAAIFNCLPGYSINNPTIDQCCEIGEFLAQLHQHRQTSIDNTNPNNLAGCQTVFNELQPSLSKQDITLITSELYYQSSYILPDLPKGVIHADLFKDNVLFDQGKISGILDFYNACNEVFIFDIAVTVNDWCVENTSINPQKFNALLSGYQKVRALTEDETRHFPIFLRLTALRFWLSRIEHQLNAKKGELTLIKDPLIFRRILEFHRANDNGQR
ncbi:MAG: homoserine kinase [Methylococcales bacterium]|nr:homoserine kinase [Methylococcales bacterium]